MSVRTIQLLHVEDDSFQQALLARYLQRIPGFHFAITCAQSEDEAVEVFRSRPMDFVVLDYHLHKGDGLSCLRTLRLHDSVVPIVAVSGQASEEIAAQLLESGADDYISKKDLQGDELVRSISLALARSDAWRRRLSAGREDGVKATLRQVCQSFAEALGRDFPHQLARTVSAARDAGLTEQRLDQLFDALCSELTSTYGTDDQTIRLWLRPVLLELRHRLALGASGT